MAFGEDISMNGISNSWSRRGQCGVALMTMVFGLLVATADAQTAAQKEKKGAALPKAKVSLQLPAAPKTVADAKAQPAGKVAKIQIDQPKFDFGDVWSGVKIEHTFVIRNVGDAVLNITRVKPSCGCTVASRYDRKIEPGQTGKIPIIVNTARLKSKVTKTITIESNSATDSPYRVTVSGTINQRFKIEPAKGGSFGRIRPDEELERKLTLTNHLDKPVELTLPAAKQGVFTGELVAKTPGQVYELIIKAKPPYAEKINRGTFKLGMENEPKITVDVMVSAYVPPLMEVTPSELIIPRAQEKASQKSVRVKFNSIQPHKVVSATVDAPDIEVELKETAPGSYEVKLGLPANYLPPTSGHKLTLKTDDPKNPEKVIKISQRRTPTRTPRQRPAMQLSGKPIPSGASFTLASGESIGTSEMKEDATLLMFYASWCGFCKRTLPKLEEISKDLEGKSARILCVSMDTIKEEGDTTASKRARTKKQVTDQWKTLGLTLPLAFDSAKAGSSLFKVQSFPTMFLLSGKTGKVERAYVGGGAASDGSLKKDFYDLLAGKKLVPQKVAPPVAQKKRRERPAMKLAGKPVPPGTFELAADGSSVSLVSSDVDATLAFFYASWCGYCKKTLPKLNAMLESDFEGKSVRFVGVNQDTIIDVPDPKKRRAKTKEQVVKQWQDFGLTFPQALDPDKVGKSAFKVQSFPTMFLIGKSGKIEKVYVGGGAANDGSLKRDINTLLAGKSLIKPAGKPVKSAGAIMPGITIQKVPGTKN